MKFTRNRRLPECKHRELKDYSIRFKSDHAYRKCNLCGRVAEKPIKEQHARCYKNAPQNWRLGLNPLCREWIKNITTDDIEIDFEGTYEELKDCTLGHKEFHYFMTYNRDIDIDEIFVDPQVLKDWCIDYVRHQEAKILRNWSSEYVQHREISYDKLLKYYNRHRNNAIYQHVKGVVNQAIREKLPYLNHRDNLPKRTRNNGL